MVIGVSSSRGFEAKTITNDGAVIDEDTYDGVPTIEGASSRKPEPSAC